MMAMTMNGTGNLNLGGCSHLVLAYILSDLISSGQLYTSTQFTPLTCTLNLIRVTTCDGNSLPCSRCKYTHI